MEHFHQDTRSRTKGGYRLLVLDGHESYHSIEFELQPIDVGCFRALKRSYGTEIEKLMHAHITHISKEDFFPAFHIAFRTKMIKSNI